MSVVVLDYLQNFEYPTPYEIHFTNSWADSYGLSWVGMGACGSCLGEYRGEEEGKRGRKKKDGKGGKRKGRGRGDGGEDGRGGRVGNGYRGKGLINFSGEINFDEPKTDPDLAAHFMITRSRGVTLFGPEIPEIFPKIPENFILS
jgi:hypothetical protein